MDRLIVFSDILVESKSFNLNFHSNFFCKWKKNTKNHLYFWNYVLTSYSLATSFSRFAISTVPSELCRSWNKSYKLLVLDTLVLKSLVFSVLSEASTAEVKVRKSQKPFFLALIHSKTNKAIVIISALSSKMGQIKKWTLLDQIALKNVSFLCSFFLFDPC